MAVGPLGFWATCFGSKDAVSLGCQPGVRVVPFHVWTVLGSPPFFLRLLSSSVGLPATTLTTEPHDSKKLVFTLERAFNLDTSIVCIFPDKDGEHLVESKKVPCRELFQEKEDFVLEGLRNRASTECRKVQFRTFSPSCFDER